MGVLNVTADSFSDGGRYLDGSDAVAHGLLLRDQGADIVDVGGESTRPGAARIDPAAEAARVVPVIAELAAAGVTVSVDTMRASVAARAVEAGARLVNDVSGGRADPDMARVLADAGLPWILMHWRPVGAGNGVGPDPGAGGSDRHFTHRAGDAGGYRDVVAEVTGELLGQVDAAVAAGVDPDRLILDPGLGFAKTAAHNWALLHALPTLVGLGFPILVGASRKRFLGSLLATGPGGTGGDRAPAGRDTATAAISALAAAGGAWGVRVHDVPSSRDAVLVASAWTSGGARGRETAPGRGGDAPGATTLEGN